MNFVKIKDLKVKYPESENYSLQIDELEIDEGETVLVTGKSGSGKSTFANVINGVIPKLLEADVKGKIEIFSQDISPLSVHDISLLVGTLLQDPDSQILNYFVRDEIAFPLENLAFPKEEIMKRVQEASEWVGITHLLDRETFTLSGGEKQRVVLASILAIDPKGLILDEPTSSLDSKGTKDVLERIKGLRKGKSVILVEHKVSKVIDFVDRILVIEQGKIIYNLKPSDALKMSEELEKLGIETPTKLPKVEKRKGEKTLYLSVEVKTKKGKKLVDVETYLNAGEITAIMGINGSGKSTLLKAISGLLSKDLLFEGKITIGNKDLTRVNLKERGKYIAYLPQDVDLLFIKRSVEDEIRYSMKLRGIKDEKLLEDLLTKFSLLGVRKNDPFLISVGQKRRTAIASILASGVKVILLDEPTTGQDWYHRKILGEDLKKLDNHVIVVVTHDPRFAYLFADRVLVLYEGKIVLDGTPDEVLPLAVKYGVVTKEEVENELPVD
ncbi:ABC transporter ATP-binding protein [Sulfurisphaera javensis]|uniref:ABC transporter ATP-binding protein n=1 Tax=Sulfurisphaera javensis TaxID=2049879 RepID=A0AAT9GT58_9CREN